MRTVICIITEKISWHFDEQYLTTTDNGQDSSLNSKQYFYILWKITSLLAVSNREPPVCYQSNTTQSYVAIIYS